MEASAKPVPSPDVPTVDPYHSLDQQWATYEDDPEAAELVSRVVAPDGPHLIQIQGHPPGGN